MASLASFLIGVAGRRAAARFEEATRDPVDAQNRKLLEILARNRDTEYGRAHRFAQVLDLRAYRRFVPSRRTRTSVGRSSAWRTASPTC